jgi:hypothetical protein
LYEETGGSARRACARVACPSPDAARALTTSSVAAIAVAAIETA